MSDLRGRLGLLVDDSFRRLFAAATASQFAEQIGILALPLVAVLALAASEFEVGLLFTLSSVSFLVVGLPAGAWVDRLRRRHVLIVCDLAQAALLLSIPIAWWAGVLTLGQLYAVALLRGVTTLFFDVAYQSYLPHLVGRDNLVEANAKLEGVRAFAQVAGPGLAGQLIQAVTAAGALLGSAFAAALSAVLVSRIRQREEPPTGRHQSPLLREIGEGLRFVLGHRLLRPIATCNAIFNLFWSGYIAMFIVYLVRDLGLREDAVGLILMYSGAGGLVGLFLVRRVVTRVGQGPTLWLTPLCVGISAALLPAARPGPAVWAAASGHLLAFAGMIVYKVTQVSFRQRLTPDRLLGRVTATMRFLVWGAMPVGALLGGALGQSFGPRQTLWICAAGVSLSFLAIFLSPLRRMRVLPSQPYEDVEVKPPTS
jgi:predicted MFS family arabinose efflux permease